MTVYLHTLSPFAIHFWGNFGLRWYSLAYLAGFIATYFVICFLHKHGRTSLSAAQASDFVCTAALGTIIGGRLGYCIFYAPNLFLDFSENVPFWGVLAIHRGGMASHGGMIGIVLACLYFARRNKIQLAELTDICAISGPLGIFFGRIANFVNGELVGRAVTAPISWAVRFPQDILQWSTTDARMPQLAPAVKELFPSLEWQQLVESSNFSATQHQRLEGVLASIVEAVQAGNSSVQNYIAPLLTIRYPSQLYEAALEGALLFALLALIWCKPRKPGIISASFIVSYGIVRILGEQFREPDAQIGFEMFGLTRGQILSSVMCLIGTGIFCILVMRSPNPYKSAQQQ